MANTGHEDISRRNQRAWSELYRSTAELVWGRHPVGFLEAFLLQADGSLPRLGRVLDAATGEGRNLELLRSLADRLSACDGSPEALAKIPEALADDISFSCCDLVSLPYADHEFDFVLLCDTLETLPEPLAVLKELRRVTAPNGRLLCNIPGPEGDVAGEDMTPVHDGFLYQDRYYYRFYTDEAARALLAQAGWRVVRAEAMTWEEAPHPGFRAHVHSHLSQIYLLAPEPL